MTASLDSLDALDREAITFFIAGPGVGEGIAIALPGRGWILLDGCRTRGASGADLPLLAILERWQLPDDPVAWMILTHPHLDHADGFAEVLDAVKPVSLGLAGIERPRATAVELVQEAIRTGRRTEEQLRARQVEAALLAMADWEARTGRSLTPLADGATLEVLGSTARGRIWAPSVDALGAWTRTPWVRARRWANSMSTVLDVRYGTTRLLLGGDLPWVNTGAPAAVSVGWDPVLSAHPGLAEGLQALKIPHHGSRDALHPDLVGPGAGWWSTTPYSRSRLPRTGAEDGVEVLLTHQERFSLTALPTSRGRPLPHPHPMELTPSAYEGLVSGSDAGFLADAVDIRPASIPEPLGPVLAASFDDEGRCNGRWRGSVAFDLVREVGGDLDQ